MKGKNENLECSRMSASASRVAGRGEWRRQNVYNLSRGQLLREIGLCCIRFFPGFLFGLVPLGEHDMLLHDGLVARLCEPGRDWERLRAT